MKTNRILRYGLLGLAGLAVLLLGMLAIFTVPAPSAETAKQVSGDVISISRPHPEYGDLVIQLENGGRYYVNRANEVVYFDWERLLAEVKAGDTLTLTVVEPLFWRWFGAEDGLRPDPVAGIQTQDTIYMDSSIPAESWGAQVAFSRAAWAALVCFLLLVGLEFVKRYQRSGSRGVAVG